MSGASAISAISGFTPAVQATPRIARTLPQVARVGPSQFTGTAARNVAAIGEGAVPPTCVSCY